LLRLLIRFSEGRETGDASEGLQTEAEQLALEVRDELGLGPFRRLVPELLAEHLEIPIITLSQLRLMARDIDGVADAVGLLLGVEANALSAVTVFADARRMVVHNDAHAPGRQASNLAHELAHGLLLHSPSPVIDSRGCRHWNGTIEEEANHLAGALLVPGKAARGMVRRGLTIEQIADELGCSIEMARWRVNMSGAARLASVR
jgi:Zn-dependent peptidase ImmA (M78 family)